MCVFTIKVTGAWMQEYGYWLDIMAVSCDSFDEEINKKIGRYGLFGTLHHRSFTSFITNYYSSVRC